WGRGVGGYSSRSAPDARLSSVYFRAVPYLSFLGGALPKSFLAFFISSSKRLRAAVQALFPSGTAHSPLPLQAFSPGVLPQPPWPRHSFSAWHVWALAVAQAPWPAPSFLPPLPFPLQVLRPRQICGSCRHSGFVGA